MSLFGNDYDYKKRLLFTTAYKSVKNETLDRKTISKYLSYMEDAFLIEKSMRYDIKGRNI